MNTQMAASKQLIRKEALRLGFSDIGFAKAEHLQQEKTYLKDWLDKGYHADMAYMANHFEKRLDPTKLVEGAHSVVSVLLNYKPKVLQKDPTAPKLARYAYGKDYHFVIKDKLQLLFNYIKNELYPNLEGRLFTDSAPVLDRAWAVKSGLGWIGKNTNLIHKQHGSFVFIGELIINMPLEPDVPIKDACGGCQRCIDACPTKALIGPNRLNSNKCISYLTIEHRDALPEEHKEQMQNWVFGCDICQEVCPWNWKARPTKEDAFEPHADLLTLSKEDWHNIDEKHFQELFKKSAVKRTKFKGLKRNLIFLK